MPNKKNIYRKNTYDRKNYFARFMICLIFITTILAVKNGYLNNPYISFEIIKNTFSSDIGYYSQIEDYISKLIKYKNKSMSTKDSTPKSTNSSNILYPLDGIIEKSSDGGYFILISKPTDVFSPCDGVVYDIRKKGDSYDILIQDSLKRVYFIENINNLNVKKTDILKKGQVLGKKIPFDLSEKDYVYFKLIDSSM